MTDIGNKVAPHLPRLLHRRNVLKTHQNSGGIAGVHMGGGDVIGHVAPGIIGQIAGLARRLIAETGLNRVQNRRLADCGDKGPPNDLIAKHRLSHFIRRQDAFAPSNQQGGDWDRF